MPKEQSFMVRRLPDYMLYAVARRGSRGGGIDLNRAHIEENGPDRIWFAALFVIRNDLRCPGYERERIACAGLKYPRIDVDVDIR
jgi:hypothetical protein